MVNAYSVLFIILIVLAGCQEEKATEQSAPVFRLPVEVSAHVNRAVATTGDEITFTVTIDYTPTATLNVPEFGEEIGGFRVVDMGENGPREVEDRLVLEKWYTLKADLVGSYILPKIIIPYEYEGKQDNATTAQIFIEVESVLNKEGTSEDIRDIKPLAPIERDLRPLVIIGGLCGLGAVIGLAGIVFYMKKRKARKGIVPARPAHDIAFERLNALVQKNLIEAGEVRLYYFELSEIFRQYLENRFSFFAVEQTTEEIIREIDQEPRLDENRRHDARQFLRNTDWVKFAKHNPSEDEIERDYSNAVRFIQQTKETETNLGNQE